MHDALSLFPPSRDAALARLQAFVPRAGADYARLRNFAADAQSAGDVSRLSPYLRSRLITQTRVLAPVIRAHGTEAADKFITEVFWRSYWTGWLALRPAVWEAYQADLNRLSDAVQTQSGLRLRWEDACLGRTGIEAFDHWAGALVRSGYLHNHARMWFASIWIHTLQLPWQLGADFFLRHLLDGDPASNTLGWRWVAGIQTMGKSYLATSENIATFTQGRFPRTPGLATTAAAVQTQPHPEPRPLPRSGVPRPGLRTGMLLHSDDLDAGPLLAAIGDVACLAFARPVAGISPWHLAPHVGAFQTGACADTAARLDAPAHPPTAPITDAGALADWAGAQDLDQIVTPCAPVGPVSRMFATYADRAEGPPLIQIRAPLDEAAWPLATRGFFRFRKHIPSLLREMQLHDTLGET